MLKKPKSSWVKLNLKFVGWSHSDFSLETTTKTQLVVIANKIKDGSHNVVLWKGKVSDDNALNAANLSSTLEDAGITRREERRNPTSYFL
jgi:hypothetical protein